MLDPDGERQKFTTLGVRAKICASARRAKSDPKGKGSVRPAAPFVP